MEYDALGQQVASTDALGNRTAREFDAVGSVVGVTDALGQTTAYAYDAMDRLAPSRRHKAPPLSSAMTRTAMPHRLATHWARVMPVEFDALNRVVAQVDPDGGRTVTTYDAVGRILSETDPNGAITRYAYDALGRQTSSTDGEGFVTTASTTPWAMCCR